MRRLLDIPPLIIAVGFGLVTLVGLLFASLLPEVASILTGWAAFIAAAALLFGVLNLLVIHLQRFIRGRNFFSLALILSMVITIVVGYMDRSISELNGLNTIFQYVLQPLEAALGSLLAFFLLFAGFRLLQRQQSGWSVLFIGAVILFLMAAAPMPAAFSGLFSWVQDYIAPLFVHAGVRAILIGVALGTITLALRLLVGIERPYSK
jgi:hypothetical protein